jgi:hypothetical protein
MPWVKCVIHPIVSLDSLAVTHVRLLFVYKRIDFAFELVIWGTLVIINRTSLLELRHILIVQLLVIKHEHHLHRFRK